MKEIPSQEDQLTFEEICDSIKNFTKLVGKVENMRPENKALLGGWISTFAKVFRRKKNMFGENLPGRFEHWMHKECGMKKHANYNYKNLFKLIKIAPKLKNCRVNRRIL